MTLSFASPPVRGPGRSFGSAQIPVTTSDFGLYSARLPVRPKPGIVHISQLPASNYPSLSRYAAAGAYGTLTKQHGVCFVRLVCVVYDYPRGAVILFGQDQLRVSPGQERPPSGTLATRVPQRRQPGGKAPGPKRQGATTCLRSFCQPPQRRVGA